MAKLDLDGNGDRDLGFKVFKLKESNFKNLAFQY